MHNLPWITEHDFNECVDELLKRIDKAKSNARTNLEKNVIDPFAILCLAHTLEIADKGLLVDAQCQASIASGVSSAIGNFHQDVLSRAPGFIDHNAGYDIENPERKIIAEIKNKHNTMNSKNKTEVITSLRTTVMSKPGYTAYLVIILPKTAKRYEKQLDDRVVELDGSSFYDLATGHPKALLELYQHLEARLPVMAPEIAKYCQDMFKEGIPE